jgi:glutathione peroxidase-family protein
MYTKHCEVIEYIYHNYPDNNFIITGDFNLNQFDWSINPIIQDHISGSIKVNYSINYLNLKQVNTILNCSGRILDCIMISANAKFTYILYSVESLIPKIGA